MRKLFLVATVTLLAGFVSARHATAEDCTFTFAEMIASTRFMGLIADALKDNNLTLACDYTKIMLAPRQMGVPMVEKCFPDLLPSILRIKATCHLSAL